MRATQHGASRMYGFLLPLHSILRWVVLALALWAIVEALRGRASGQYVGRSGLLFTIGLDVQLLLGLALYFTSPTVAVALSDLGTAMKAAPLRFWAVEHSMGMVLALVFAHGARVLARKADSQRAAAGRGLIGFAVALVLILASIPWPFRKAIARALLPGL